MEVILSIRAENLLAKIAGLSDKLRKSLVLTMRRLAISVQRAVKAEKLTGQVLQVRTGTLRRSINQEVTETADGIHAIVGTNVVYARVHEYGFSGVVDVKAHARQVRQHSKISKNTGKLVRGKVVGVAMVKAHTRKVNLPERSFLRTTLREFEPQIQADLRRAALDVFQEAR